MKDETMKHHPQEIGIVYRGRFQPSCVEIIDFVTQDERTMRTKGMRVHPSAFRLHPSGGDSQCRDSENERRRLESSSTFHASGAHDVDGAFAVTSGHIPTPRRGFALG